MGWKELLFSCFYTAVVTVISPEKHSKGVTDKLICKLIKDIRVIDSEVTYNPQITNYKYNHFTEHNISNQNSNSSEKAKEVQLPNDLSLIIAHSMTPLPKKLVQGKRFNLRRCEIMIAIEYIKSSAGTSKDLKSLSIAFTII